MFEDDRVYSEENIQNMQKFLIDTMRKEFSIIENNYRKMEDNEDFKLSKENI